ncbi:hypothetical protein [Polaromonas sp. UC242_47]|uniref:hypothetical protein n=1 Tax=Polaromonas sp. UC242_47 TaxID=3374626 RepID=UPI00379F1EA2
MPRIFWPLGMLAALTACTGVGSLSGAQSYRCEHGISFQVRFVDDSALLDGTGGSEVLFRDAGGQGPQQTVYSSPRLRAEFGLGAQGREAQLSYPLLPLNARCVQD